MVIKMGFFFKTGTAATTSASTTGFSLGFTKPAASATPFALPAASTSASGLTLSSALTSTPAGEADGEWWHFLVSFSFLSVNEHRWPPLEKVTSVGENFYFSH